MKTKYFFALLLLGLAVLFSMLPIAKAVTIVPPGPAPQRTPSPSATSDHPCTPLASAQASVFALKPVKISKPFSGGSIVLNNTAGSCWVSEEEMILFRGPQLVKFNITTGSETPIAGTEDVNVGKHWVSICALSPDGRWLVWAGGIDGHSTWDAVTTDGTEHRQWPRDESNITPAIAWMQDNQHWVELRVPETKSIPIGWMLHPDNMRAKVYSLDSPDAQDFPLQLETPDPSFILPTNCSKTCEFLFTSDGHAWLSESGQAMFNVGEKPSSREAVYELIPSATVWKLHATCLYPKADPDHWMFDLSARSPDDNWIVWRNYIPNGKDHWKLMLSRTDGTDMQMIYQSDTTSGGSAEWTPDSRQISFTDNGITGLVTINLSDLIACRPFQSQGQKLSARITTQGPFPVGPLKMLPFIQSRIANRQ